MFENGALGLQRFAPQTIGQSCSDSKDVPAAGPCRYLGEAESPVAVLHLQEMPLGRPSHVDLAVVEPGGPEPQVAHFRLRLFCRWSAELPVLVGPGKFAERNSFAAEFVRSVGGQYRAQRVQTRAE